MNIPQNLPITPLQSKAARYQLGLTQANVIQESSLPGHKLKGFETGRLIPDMKFLESLANFYQAKGIELSELTDFPIMKSRKMLNVMFRLGLKAAYGDQADAVRAAAMEFIASCPLAARIGQTVFVSHSCPEHSDTDCFAAEVLARPYAKRDLCDGGAAFRTVWGRDFRSQNAAAFAKTVNAKCLIHGH